VDPYLPILVLYVLPWLAACFSVVSTTVHTRDEVTGENGPIWDYLLPDWRVPYWAGLAGLLSLAVGLSAAGWFAWAGGSGWWASVLFGARVGDGVFSHWLPWFSGRRPNPGMATTPLYAVESVVLLSVFDLDFGPAVLAALGFAAVWVTGRLTSSVTKEEAWKF
jgi:hypothetical protein